MGSREQLAGDVDPTIIEVRGDASIDARVVAEADDAREVPAQLGRFRVIEPLGRGGMGIVYAAEDPDLGRRVAIKLLHERVGLQSRGRARLEREARSLAALSHPNVVHVYEIGAHEGHVYIAMEHVPGRSLRQWLHDRPRSWREIVKVFCRAGDGLAAAHRAGIVHRDFKPDNVLVDPDDWPRVLDFGLAAHAAGYETFAEPAVEAVEIDGLTATGTVMGTPAYMAPEQHTGATLDARTDQFAFCVALYEALFGQRPYVGDTLERLRASVLGGKMTLPTKHAIPRPVLAVLRRGLATHPEDRYATMAELLTALRRAAADRSALRRSALAIGGGLAVVAAAIGISMPRMAPGPVEPTPMIVADAPWLLTMKPLTKTPGAGLDAMAIDRAGTTILYSIDDQTWRRALHGGTPEPIRTPGSGHPWWLAFTADGRDMFAMVEGDLWRIAADERTEVIARGIGSQGYVRIAPDDRTIATLGDERLSIRTLGQDPAIVKPLPGAGPAGLAWDASGTHLATQTIEGLDRTDLSIVDRSGTVLAVLALGGGSIGGLAWIGDAHVVVATGSATALELRCIAFDRQRGTLHEIARSQPLPHPAAQSYIMGVTDDGALLAMQARRVRDVAIGPTIEGEPPWQLVAPDVDAGNRTATWIGADTLVLFSERDLVPTAVIQDLAASQGTTIDALGGPLSRISATDDHDIIAVVAAHGDAPAAVHVLSADRKRHVRVAGSETIAAKTLDVRCDGTDACVLLVDDDDGMRFYALDPTTTRIERRAACPRTHGCDYGTFAPARDASRVLIPTRDYKKLDWVDLHNGEIVGHGPAIPPGYEAGSVVTVPPGDDVIVTLTLDPTGRSEQPPYAVARLTPDGAAQFLWASADAYFRRPVISPDGQRMVVDAATFHTEAVLIEGAAQCTTLMR